MVDDSHAGVWTGTGWYVVPQSPQQLMAAIGAIGVFSKNQRFAWRGLSDMNYRLTSSLQRKLGEHAGEEDVRRAETELLNDARDWGLGVGETAYVDDLQLLADLQHYGVETRLIDVTSNPMTALWFACQAPRTGNNRKLERRGVLLAINTTSLVNYKTVGQLHELTLDDLKRPNAASLNRALGIGKPFVVRSLRPNDRLRAQEGYFVSSAVPRLTSKEAPFTPLRGLNLTYPEGDPELLAQMLKDRAQYPQTPVQLPFVAVIIRASLKQRMLSYLESSYNRSANVIFPDFAGFAEYRAHGGRDSDPAKVAGRS